MDPLKDVICSLLETPFRRWNDEVKKDILMQDRPTHSLTIVGRKEVKNSGKSYNIYFKSLWFTQYKWLCSSPELQKLFCWPCLLFSHKSSPWSKEGFSDLLNITRSLHKHGDSSEHLKCEIMLKNVKDNNTTANALNENARLYKINFNENVRLNRLFLQVVIDAAVYLSTQEQVFQSSDSASGSNFKELVSVLISRSPLEIRNQYEKIKSVFTGDSKTTQNELIECISEYINDHVKSEIRETSLFSIQVDDTRDIHHASQFSVIIRFIDSEGILVERFLGFHDVSEDRTAENVYEVIHNILEPFDYQNKLIGQCYDGASVMSGHLNELQKTIKDKAPRAVSVHSLAHRLNFVLQQNFSKISECRIFFASISGIPSFFHHAAKRSYIFTSTSSKWIPTITQTQWSSNSNLVSAIVEEWYELKKAFEFLANSEQSDKKTIQLARGFINETNTFEFAFLAIVFNDVFNSTDILFEILQKNSLNLKYCASQIKETCELLRSRRNDNVFETLFERAKKISGINTIKMEDEAVNSDPLLHNSKQLYFEILDHILIDMETRFQDCEKLQFVCLADTTKFEDFNSCFPSNDLENLQQFYGKLFTNPQRLKNELMLLYSNENNKNISTQELLQVLNKDKDIFVESYRLLSLILTIPSTSVSEERHFSCLERIKTYSRDAISQEKSTHLANIFIQKEVLLMLTKKQPFYDDIIENFAALKDSGIDLIYKK